MVYPRLKCSCLKGADSHVGQNLIQSNFFTDTIKIMKQTKKVKDRQE